MVKKSENNHIIVSGGARGLGLGIVSSLLRHGYRVSSFSRGRTEEMDLLSVQYEGRFYFEPLDITQTEALKNFVKKAVQCNGTLYGVVNNAAVVQEGILATLPEVEVGKMIAVNLEGAIRLTRLCMGRMLMSAKGRVVNISSIIGTRGYNGLTVYSATKAGLDGFTRSLAREVGRKNITVNAIAPGYMKTEMSSSLNDKQLQQIIRRTPMHRLADLEDVLPLLRFLLSDDACFITGQTILVDGGISC